VSGGRVRLSAEERSAQQAAARADKAAEKAREKERKAAEKIAAKVRLVVECVLRGRGFIIMGSLWATTAGPECITCTGLWGRAWNLEGVRHDVHCLKEC
jgi:hypothetical protein